MLTKPQALKLASDRLLKMSPSDDIFAIVDAETIEKPFGWVFFYNSKKFLDGGRYSDRLAGNGPVIVNAHNGTVEFFGSGRSPLEIVQEYESKLAKGDTT
jgi:hypothetical protein